MMLTKILAAALNHNETAARDNKDNDVEGNAETGNNITDTYVDGVTSYDPHHYNILGNHKHNEPDGACIATSIPPFVVRCAAAVAR